MIKKTTTQTILQAKGKKQLVAITAYDALMARYADESGVDLILVGDSVGTTVLGMDTTVTVTLDMIMHHTAAVKRGVTNALVVADLPFPEAHYSQDVLLNACSKLMCSAGAEAVKLEGGQLIASKVAHLVNAGVPVVGHIGLLPQRFYVMGGYRKFGKNKSEQDVLVEDAKALENAGVFAIVAEMIDAETSARICREVSVPIIGIGCGTACDGQILVSTDMLGMNTGKVPSFVKVYSDLKSEIIRALGEYATDVREKKYP